MRSYKGWSVVGAIVLVLIIATLAHNSLSKSSEHRPDNASEQAQVLTPSHSGSVAAVLVKHIRDSPVLRQLHAADAQALADKAAQHVTIYTSGDLPGMDETMNAYGLRRVLDNVPSESRDQAWRASIATVVGAVLKPEASRVESRVVGGRRLAEPKPAAGMGSYQTVRPGRDGTKPDVSPFGTSAAVFDVNVPGTFKNHEGKTFEGTFSLRYAKRPVDGEWVLIGTAIHDVVAGAAPAPPV